MIGKLLLVSSVLSAMRACVASDPNADIHALWQEAIEARITHARANQPISLINELIPTEDACETLRARAAGSPSAARAQARCVIALPLLRAAVARSPEWIQMASQAAERIRPALRSLGTGKEDDYSGPSPVHAQLACRVARLTAELSATSRELTMLCDKNEVLLRNNPHVSDR